ncbi:hypothetical protein ACOME3_009242 [Neoechinorhynchus agilis]
MNHNNGREISISFYSKLIDSLRERSGNDDDNCSESTNISFMLGRMLESVFLTAAELDGLCFDKVPLTNLCTKLSIGRNLVQDMVSMLKLAGKDQGMNYCLTQTQLTATNNNAVSSTQKSVVLSVGEVL